MTSRDRFWLPTTIHLEPADLLGRYQRGVRLTGLRRAES